MQPHDVLRALVQIARAAVVAQAAPQRKHFVLRCRCQVANGGETREEPVVINKNRGDLRLLQHDFRQPDAIRITRVLPRQAIASVRALPANNLFGEFLGLQGCRLNFLSYGVANGFRSFRLNARTVWCLRPSRSRFRRP